jgi:hypothetical protein
MKKLIAFLLLIAPLLGKNFFYIEEKDLEVHYEDFVCRQKDQTFLAGLTPPCKSTPCPCCPSNPLECLPKKLTVPRQSGKITVLFANCSQHKEIKHENIFFSIKGKTLDATKEKPSGALIEFDSSGDGTLVPATDKMKNTKQYTYALSTLPKTAEGLPYCFIPRILSARMHVCLGYPMYMKVEKQVGSAGDYFAILDSEPAFSGKEPQDPLAAYNYSILYDKVEFDYENPNVFIINGTAVDYWGLPISIRVLQEGICNIYTSGVPPNFSRERLVRAFFKKCDSLPTKDAQNAWRSLVLMAPEGTLLRLMSPLSAMDPGTKIKTPFPKDYLCNLRFGKVSWIDGWWDHYRTNFLRIDVSEIQGYGIYKGQVIGNAMHFIPETSSHAPVILTKPTNSLPFFTGTVNKTVNDKGGFDIQGDGAAADIIARELSAGFVSGILPCRDGVCLSKEFFSQEKDSKGFYQSNSFIPDGGPWYCLYSKVIHNRISPPYNTYTCPYDDALNNDGTISMKNIITNPPAVIITIGDMRGTRMITPPPLPLSWEN